MSTVPAKSDTESPRTPSTLIRGGRIVDPANDRDGIFDILIEGGLIASVCEGIPSPPAALVMDASHLVIVPGLIDMHVHLREPGFEHKETILTGARAAAAGGFTAVACMANTKPVTDTPEILAYILEKAVSAPVRVYPVAAVTRSLLGREVSPLEEIRAAGAVAFSDDGAFVSDAAVMLEALQRAAALRVPILSHPELKELSRDGAMNEGVVSAALNCRGIPRQAEEMAIYRDIALADLTGTHLHVMHVSTSEGIELIRRAKARGVRLTAEASPHHLTTTDEAVRTHGANAKMSPPLRSAVDVEAVAAGLCDGTIDAVASDHAPHSPAEKAAGLADAPLGIIGLETAVGLVLTHFVNPGIFDLSRLVETMSVAPARILGIPGGRIDVGAPADLTILDLAATWTVTKEDIVSKSCNTPYIGARMRGRVAGTIVGGNLVYRNPQSLDAPG